MEPFMEKLKTIWPDWEIVDKIGEGAFGQVFRAVRHDLAGTSYAAIKAICIPKDNEEIEELKAEGLSTEQSYTYFRQVVKDYTHEIRLMESVKGYTNIVSIDDYKIIESDDEMLWYIFIRMELLTPLVAKTAADEITEQEIIRAGIDLCNALDICRKKNIVHRDIKPQNIFVNDEGDYKLGDFGVARSLSRTATNLSRKGAPNYMAPELYRASLREINIDDAVKVDIYSLGLVLYWMGNNLKLPFQPLNKQVATPEDRENAFIKRISGEELPAPSEVSPELQRIILRACAYDPDKRYASAAEMREDLIRLRAGESGTAAKTGTPPAGDPADLTETLVQPPEDPGEKTVTGGLPEGGVSPGTEGPARGKRRRLWPKILLTAVLAAAVITGVLYVLGILPVRFDEDGITIDSEHYALMAPAPSNETETPLSTPNPDTTAPPTAPPTETPTPEQTPEPTPAPTPEETPTPTSTPTPEPATPEPVPVLSSGWTGISARIHEFSPDKATERITLYAGPGKEYGKSVKMTPNSQKKVTVYFSENDWVFTYIIHRGGALYVYVPRKYFDYLESVPEAGSLSWRNGTVTAEAVPRWGPGDEFDAEEDCTASQGTALKVFFTEGVYSFCEYECSVGKVRMWLPSALVQLTE